MKTVLSYYSRYTENCIDTELQKAITEGVKEAVAKDPEFRKQVEDVIKLTLATLPIEVLVKSVKDAIRESMVAK